ncbi:MAG: hypothetical protein J5865_09175, partial [Lachnospiraceae bacterium]|nr:hypothetical protein [Lachnospiraceae bacterium]
MKSAEEMTRDVLKRRDEELIKRKKRRMALGITAAALAACLLLAVLIPRLQKDPGGADGTKIAEGGSSKAAESTDTEATDTAETTMPGGENKTTSGTEASAEATSQPEPTTEDPLARVIWTAESWSSADAEYQDSMMISDNVQANKYLAQALEKAKDDDVLAFIFSPKRKGDRSYGGDEWEKLVKRWNDLDYYAYELRERLQKELMEKPGVTGTEANARITNMPEYQQACNEAYQAQVAINVFENREIFEGMEDTLAIMQKNGFTVLCTNADDSYVDHIDWYSGMAVLSGTAAQIKALKLEGFGKDVERLNLLGTKPVERDPEEFGDGMYPTHLRDDSKLTDELRAAYAENGGAPVKVIVKMGWLGEWVDPHEYAYAALGMTA